MTTEQELDIDAICARCNAATPGPWVTMEGIALKHYVFSPDGEMSFSLQELHPIDGRMVPAAANAAFIAHSREDVPALCDEVKRLRAELSEAKGRLEALEELRLEVAEQVYGDVWQETLVSVCRLCGNAWQQDKPECHSRNCLAAQARALALKGEVEHVDG